MFLIYVIQLPSNWSPRVLAFKNKQKANEVCDALNHEHGASASRGCLEVCEMHVLEDEDIRVIKEDENQNDKVL